MKFLREIYSPERITKPSNMGYRSTAASAPSPATVAGYIRTFLAIMGTVLALLPPLDFLGLPVNEWLAAIFGASCL